MDKVKSIETKNLMIKGNIIEWPGTMIQLSNISCISTADMALKPFPWLSLLVMALGVGLGVEKVNGIIAFLIVLAGLTWIFLWHKKNEQLKENTYLNILLNSGDKFQILFSYAPFLDKVLNVLEEILIEGGVGSNSNVSINITDCKIDGNAKVLNDFKVR